MESLLVIRKAVVDLMEKARSEKWAVLCSCWCLIAHFTKRKLRSSLEADVLLILPDGSEDSRIVGLLHSQGRPTECQSHHTYLTLDILESFLSRLFIVSEVSLENDQAQVYDGEWAYSELVPIAGMFSMKALFPC
jgi:hypothetical protein